MKPLAKLLLSTLLLAAAAQGQDDERDKQRARDRLVYTLNLSVSPMREMCSEVVTDYGTSLDRSYPAWLERNKAGIERGREETRLSFGRSGDIDGYESTTLAEIRASFSTLTKDRKKSRCLGLLQALSGSP